MPAIEVIDRLRSRYAKTTDFEDPNVPQQYPPDLELEPVHLDIDLFMDIANETAGGKVTTTVRARRDGPTKLALDAVDFVDVGVRDTEDRDLTWRYDGRKITIQWAAEFKNGEERRAEITYRVIQPVDGLFFSKPNSAYPNQAWYAATDHETERARHWLPCIDLPNVRTTLDFHLRAEERFTILANGLLIKETVHDDGTKTAHWRLKQLCPSYLVCIAIGDFVRANDGVFNDGEKQIELAYFCSREHDAESLMRTFGRTRPMMSWMTRKLAMPFPYPKYFQFALPDMGGAMENISLVSWTDWAVMDEIMAGEMTWYIDQINVHEMAHSYFGDAVVVRDFAHAWLKESWATFMEQCWREDEYGQDQGQYVYYDHAQAYFREADERYKRPIVTRRFKSSWQLYDGHLYPGGACRLHTLRSELGEKVFWAAVQDYLRRYSGRVVETDDFRHVMEEHSGRSLGQFFDQWFRSPGYPDLKVSFNYDSKQKIGTFEIEQKQVDKEKGIPTFALSTDLGWTIDGKSYRLPVKIDQAKHAFTVAMNKEPEQVRFDPAHRALHKLEFNPGDPMLRRQLTEAKDTIGRIQAAHELAKTGKRANIQAIVDAYADEPFWGTRIEMLKALAKANTEAALAGLVKIIGLEEEPIVLYDLFGTAGKYRDSRIRDVVGARIESGLPHMALDQAYRAMGAQRKEARWDILLEASEHYSFNGIAQAGAFHGLAATRRDEAVDILLEQMPYGRKSNRVRPAIAAGMADIGKGLEKKKREQVTETLVDLLRDPWWRVRNQAVYGLAEMEASEAIPALEAYSRTVSRQDQVRVEKVISSLREADKSDGSAVKKQVEELQEKVRKLEDQLQMLEAKVEPAEAEESESAED